MIRSSIIHLLLLNCIFLFNFCHRNATSNTTINPNSGSSFSKPENGTEDGRTKNSKIAKNSFNPGNPKSSNPEADKQKLLDPNATNVQTKKTIKNKTTTGTNPGNPKPTYSKPGNSKPALSKPGKLKAPKKKKKKRFMA
jgi:hypothetical protein